MSGYLVGGYTESDNEPFWRNYVVPEMEFVIMLDETFASSREGYNADDKSMDEIYCRL